MKPLMYKGYVITKIPKGQKYESHYRVQLRSHGPAAYFLTLNAAKGAVNLVVLSTKEGTFV